MEGKERLEQETIEMNNYNVVLIFNYIKDQDELQEKFDNEEKTIKGMYEFICGKAKTLAQNGVAAVNDKVVYLWAITYFCKSNEELGIKKEEKKIKSATDASKESISNKEKGIKESDEQVSMFEEVL